MKKYEYLDEFIKIPVLKRGSIYHYTSAEGVLGILNNDEFWATKSDFLNDVSEFKYTFDLFEESVLSKIKNDIARSKIIRKFHAELDSEDLSLKDLSKTLSGWYVISFSTSQDNLLLWSEFTRKMGYNLEFDFQKLLSTFTNRIKFHGKVIYNKNVQVKLLKEALDMMLSLRDEYNHLKSLNDCDENTSDEIIHYLVLDMYVFCFMYSMFFKQSMFAQEKEYCFVFSAFHEAIKPETFFSAMNFRVKEDAISPFIKVPCKTVESLKSITIGPKNNIDIAQTGLELYCRNQKIEIPILQSKIPLRY